MDKNGAGVDANGNPVFAHEADGTITGDAHIQKMGDVYVMFYFLSLIHISIIIRLIVLPFFARETSG